MSRETRNTIIALVMIAVILAAAWFAYRAGHWVGSN